MGGKGKKKKGQQKQGSSAPSKTAASAPSPTDASASSAAPSHGSSLDTRIPPSHHLFISSSPPLTSPSPPTGRPGEPEIFSFKVVYMEHSLEFEVQEEGGVLASEAISKGVAIATEAFAKVVKSSESESDFLAYVSYPPIIREQELTVSQWFRMGHEPFIAIGLKDKTKGFSALLQQVSEERSDLKIFNEELIANGLHSLGLQPSPSPRSCGGCKFLGAAVNTLRHENTQIRHEITQIRHEITQIRHELEKMKVGNESLLADREKMRAVRRRILVEKARRKAIRALGLKQQDVPSWQEFFRTHGKALMSQHGISKELHHLLMYGKGSLNRTVHSGLDIDLAEAVARMTNSSERDQFLHAFTYIFGCTPESFMGENDD